MDKPRFDKKMDSRGPSTKARGDVAEDLALAHLQGHGLRLVQRNFRTPGRGGGEIDLIMREPDGTLVFVEVRRRRGLSHGGAAASIDGAKRGRIVLAARHFLLRLGHTPPCRFDVVLVQGGGEANAHHALPRLDWMRAAFDTDGH